MKKNFFRFVSLTILLSLSICQGMEKPKLTIDAHVTKKTRTINALGKHHMVELFNCDKELLKNKKQIIKIMQKAAIEAGATIIGFKTQEVGPLMCCLVLVSESHLSIHANVNTGYAAVDVFTCGECDNIKAINHIAKSLSAQEHRLTTITRGIYATGTYLPFKNLSGKKQGDHHILELYGCNPKSINDVDGVDATLKNAIKKMGATVIGSVPFQFTPQGVSDIVLFSSKTGVGYITIHTWPELNKPYCAIDIFTYGKN
ncbi:MAG: adenosylmethionine decarboxylase, partial [bacterium]